MQGSQPWFCKKQKPLARTKRHELALMLVDRALQHGFDSLWLLHSKALALQKFDLAHLTLGGSDPTRRSFLILSLSRKSSCKNAESSNSLQALLGRIQQHNLQPQVPCQPGRAR